MYDLNKEFAFGQDCTNVQRTDERVLSINWMIKVTDKFEVENGVIHLAVNLDKVLHCKLFLLCKPCLSVTIKIYYFDIHY